jgi:hypothetical protein
VKGQVLNAGDPYTADAIRTTGLAHPWEGSVPGIMKRPDAEQALAGELERGEKLLGSGMSRQGLRPALLRHPDDPLQPDLADSLGLGRASQDRWPLFRGLLCPLANVLRRHLAANPHHQWLMSWELKSLEPRGLTEQSLCEPPDQ